MAPDEQIRKLEDRLNTLEAQVANLWFFLEVIERMLPPMAKRHFEAAIEAVKKRSPSHEGK